jgi:hypothetical protein
MTWRGKLIKGSGRLTLIKTILVYTVISFHLPPWFQKAMSKIFMAFLWMGTEVAQGREMPDGLGESTMSPTPGWIR